MFDLNRPLHAYDLDKIKNKIIVRNSKKGEILTALDNNNYTLDENMCVIADDEGPLGLGGIIGGTRSGTEIDTRNILIESAYFDPEITRKTAKNLDLNRMLVNFFTMSDLKPSLKGNISIGSSSI